MVEASQQSITDGACDLPATPDFLVDLDPELLVELFAELVEKFADWVQHLAELVELLAELFE